MKCITYGTAVLLMIIVTFIYGKLYTNEVNYTNPLEAEEAIQNILNGASIMGLVWLGLTIWWLVGFNSDCADGYFLNPTLKKVQNNNTYETV